ncbi:hypothetical protein [Streptomyces sp. ISL-112]|uniref:hypothetical protein n=1 Tax=unclassified Streptomyces TaxID=2593676 RepID=UPI002035B16E|nr:hypothetical protein [Streptomyces sp. ISL-112]
MLDFCITVLELAGSRWGEALSARILIAEDDGKQSQLIRIYLEREGNAVQVVADGRAAVIAAAAGQCEGQD